MTKYGLLAAWCLAACTGCALFSSPHAPPKPKPISLRFYLAGGTPVEGYRELRDELGRPLYVAGTPFLTENDVQDAAVLAGKDRSMVRLDFTMSGTAVLEDASRTHRGGRLAVYVDDELVMAPPFQIPLRGGKLILDGGFSKSHAQDIVTRLIAHRAAPQPSSSPVEPLP